MDSSAAPQLREANVSPIHNDGWELMSQIMRPGGHPLLGNRHSTRFKREIVFMITDKKIKIWFHILKFYFQRNNIVSVLKMTTIHKINKNCTYENLKVPTPGSNLK